MECDKEIVRCLEKFSGQNPWSIFSDFVNLAALALRSEITMTDKACETIENEYEGIAGKYSSKQMKLMGDMLGMLTLGADAAVKEKKFVDIIGRVYHLIAMQNSKTGQFFTPQHIADVTAGVAIESERIQKEIDERGFVKMVEPSSGGGVMVLAAAQRMYELGFNPQQQLFAETNDIDKNCVCMTYVQLSLYGIPAIVKHGDSLSGETWSRWPTIGYLLRGGGMMKCLANTID